MMSTLGQHIPYTSVINPVSSTAEIVGCFGTGLDTLHYRLLILKHFVASSPYNIKTIIPHAISSYAGKKVNTKSLFKRTLTIL
jgi:hypothetical protein